MSTYFHIAQIIIGVALIGIIILQSRQSGGAGGVFGGAGGAVHRKRRGVERTIFLLTIILSLVFFIIAIANAIVQTTGQG
jgi:preprotein translocase subunit SecG